MLLYGKRGSARRLRALKRVVRRAETNAFAAIARMLIAVALAFAVFVQRSLRAREPHTTSHMNRAPLRGLRVRPRLMGRNGPERWEWERAVVEAGERPRVRGAAVARESVCSSQRARGRPRCRNHPAVDNTAT